MALAAIWLSLILVKCLEQQNSLDGKVNLRKLNRLMNMEETVFVRSFEKHFSTTLITLWIIRTDEASTSISLYC